MRRLRRHAVTFSRCSLRRLVSGARVTCGSIEGATGRPTGATKGPHVRPWHANSHTRATHAQGGMGDNALVTASEAIHRPTNTTHLRVRRSARCVWVGKEAASGEPHVDDGAVLVLRRATAALRTTTKGQCAACPAASASRPCHTAPVPTSSHRCSEDHVVSWQVNKCWPRDIGFLRIQAGRSAGGGRETQAARGLAGLGACERRLAQRGRPLPPDELAAPPEPVPSCCSMQRTPTRQLTGLRLLATAPGTPRTRRRPAPPCPSWERLTPGLRSRWGDGGAGPCQVEEGRPRCIRPARPPRS